MAGASAFVVGLHLRTAAERMTLAVANGVLAAALLVSNGHWLSDIIGGVSLGLVIGGAVARRFFARVASRVPGEAV
jgi:membrane-associated phospholipid phosphatase